MADTIRVSFKGWTGPVKNPAAADGSQPVVEQRVNRIEVFGPRKPLDDRQIKALSQIIRDNRQIGIDMVNQISLRVRSGLGCDQYLAKLKERSNNLTTSDRVLLMVHEILRGNIASV